VRKRVLVIDDNPHDRELLVASLDATRYEVKTAENGGLGCRLAAAHPPDVIVLDLNLPDMDGYEVCQRLRAAPTTRRIPIVVLTASDDPALHRNVFAAGAQACVLKPFRREALIATLEAAMGDARRKKPKSATADRGAEQMIPRPGERQFLRYPVSLPAIGWTAQFSGGAIKGVVRDISAGGLMAELPVQLAPGSAMALVLQTRRGPLDLKGRVVWTATSQDMVRHGFAFPEPKGQDFALNLFVAESQ
jgi:CheY-like chemotaxis protein